MNPSLARVLLPSILIFASNAHAADTIYTIDPDHTHPAFEVDRLGGLSVWRGFFKKSSGTITLDPVAGTGSVVVNIDPSSVDFGVDKLNEHVIAPDILDVAQFPSATYRGVLSGFKDGAPSSVTGELTLHGVTKPVNLQIDSFKCMPHPIQKREVCGADAIGHFNRADFGVNYGEKAGFRQDVALRIQVEALKAE
jgi:polyisoprenoid-binding protein YceI